MAKKLARSNMTGETDVVQVLKLASMDVWS